MKNFGTALKRALDANGRLPSEWAKAAGVTGDAVARWMKCIPFQRKKNPSQIHLVARGFFVCYRLATVAHAAKSIRSAAYTRLSFDKKSPTAPTVGLLGHALTGQGKENKAMEIYYNQLAAGK